MTRASLLAALLAALVAAPALAQQREPAERSSLERPESPVVLAGERLPALLGAPIARLRALALRRGALAPIPLQVDERMADGSYALDRGDERRSDPDDGALDANDELALMGCDAGDRLAPADLAALRAAPAQGPGHDGAPPASPRRWVEVELAPTRGGAARGWVYLTVAEGSDPPPAPDDRVQLDWQQGDLAGFTTRRAKLGCAPGATCLLDLRELRFVRPDGALGADVLDRAKLALSARYLFLDIARRIDEVRTRVVAWRDGPLRAIVRFQAETYLIWGHWVRSNVPASPTRCRATIWEDRLEVELELLMPVALEADTPSELRLGLDLAPSAGPAAVWTDRSRVAIRSGSARARDLRDVDRGFPRWLVTTCAEGAFALRLELGPELDRPGNRLSIIDGDAPDPPEDHAGSILSPGWMLDLTGLPPQTCRARLVMQLGAPVDPGQEGPLLRVDDDPLVARVTER